MWEGIVHFVQPARYNKTRRVYKLCTCTFLSDTLASTTPYRDSRVSVTFYVLLTFIHVSPHTLYILITPNPEPIYNIVASLERRARLLVSVPGIYRTILRGRDRRDWREYPLDELLVVDDARAIWIDLGDHLVQLLLGQAIDAQVADDVPHLAAIAGVGVGASLPGPTTPLSGAYTTLSGVRRSHAAGREA